jgi:hypothetical protein
MQFVLTPTKVSEFTYVSTIFPFSPTLLWVMPSNDEYVSDGVSYSTNESGFREYPNLSEHNGSILFLGDSSTFGFGVSAEQSYAARLGSCLQKKVINLATPGYSSTQSRIQLGELIHEHRAAERGSLTADIKYVVIANLWSDMMAAPQTDTQRLLLIEEVLEQRELFDSILYRWSYTFRLLSALLQEEGSEPNRHCRTNFSNRCTTSTRFVANKFLWSVSISTCTVPLQECSKISGTNVWRSCT